MSWAIRANEMPNSYRKVFWEPFFFPFFSICSLLKVLVFAFIVLYISLLVEKLFVYTSIFVDGFKEERKYRILEGFGKQSVKMKVGGGCLYLHFMFSIIFELFEILE